MATPNLAITHIATNQNSKEITANSAFDSLDQASNGYLAVPMADANQALSVAQIASAVFYDCTGTDTADRTLTVATKRFFVVRNSTTGGHNIIVKSGSGSTVTVAAGALHLLFSDGTNVIQIV